MAEITEQEYKDLKEEVENAKTAAARAAGALDSLKTRLKEDFDCASLEEAEKKLKELEEKKARTQSAFEKAMKDYEKKWKTHA